jgi:hypothetical protein
MYKTVVFYSDREIPNDGFTQETMQAVASYFAANKIMSVSSESKSDWKKFLEQDDVSEIVLVGVNDPGEYEVPLDGLTDMLTDVNGHLVPCKFQVIDRKGVLIFSKAEYDRTETIAEAAYCEGGLARF